MIERAKIIVGLGLAGLLAAPLAAQVTQEAGKATQGGTAKEAEKPGGAASAAEGKENDIRIKFDEDSAKGEILCKEGKVKGDAVEYKKCAKDKFDAYDEIAIKKKIVASKAEYEKLSKKDQNLAKKLAFYDSAEEAVKGKMRAAKAAKDAQEYKKLKGAERKIEKNLARAAKESKKSKVLKYEKEPADAED
jgi:hypothetical protein